MWVYSGSKILWLFFQANNARSKKSSRTGNDEANIALHVWQRSLQLRLCAMQTLSLPFQADHKYQVHPFPDYLSFWIQSD